MHRVRAVVGLMLLVALWASPSEAASLVVINELLANPGGLDANRDGTSSNIQDEFVELANAGTTPVELVGWTLSDAIQVRHSFVDGATIPGGGFLVIFGGGIPVGFTNATTASAGRLGLNNSGDTISLRDPLGTLIDTLAYGSSTPGESLTRAPDGLGDFVGHLSVSDMAFSSGSAVDGFPSLPSHADPPMVPEPSSLMLLGAGLWGWLPFSRRKTGGFLNGAR